MLENDWDKSQRKGHLKSKKLKLKICQKFQIHNFNFKIFTNVPSTYAHVMAVIEAQ